MPYPTQNKSSVNINSNLPTVIRTVPRENEHNPCYQSEKVKVSHSAAAAAAKSLSRVRLRATPETAAHQAPLSMGFSRQEYWSG